MKTTVVFLVWLLALAALTFPCMAQEPEEGAQKQERAEKRPDIGEARDRIREILKKQEQGVALTREEQELLERARAMRDRGRGEDNLGGRFREPNPFADLGTVNVVDEALYSVAEIFYDKGEYQNAVDELAKVAADSPDEHAKSGAHLVAGHIYRLKLANPKKAIEEYKQVTGDLADRAIRAIVKCYEDAGQPDEAAQVLEEKLAQATQPVERAAILSEIAGVYRRCNNLDKAIETLRRIPKMITYEEAEAIRAENAGRRMGFNPMDRAGGDRGGHDGGDNQFRRHERHDRNRAE